MSTIEGAENLATVPPTDSTVGDQLVEQASNTFGPVVDVNATDNANAAGVVDQQAEGTATTENADVDATDANETPEQKAEREKFIPRDRFDQVNAKAQRADELEQRLAAIEAERTQERETIAAAQKAVAAGYATVEAYNRDTELVKAQGYTSVEEYNALVALREQTLAEQPDISETVLNKLLVQEQKLMRAEARSNQLDSRLQSVEVSSRLSALDRDIATASADLREAGVDANAIAEFEKTVRKVGHPQAIADFAPILKLTASAAGKNAVIANNERRAANGNGAPPAEGRGGGTPPVQVPKMSAKQAKGTLISDLLGMRKNYG